jgi:hypothetical protein
MHVAGQRHGIGDPLCREELKQTAPRVGIAVPAVVPGAAAWAGFLVELGKRRLLKWTPKIGQ